MNKKIIAIGIISIFLLGSNISLKAFELNGIKEQENITYNEQITLVYTFERPTVEKINTANTVYDRLDMDSSPCFGNAGEPSLPARGAYILLPQGEKVSNIKVTYGNRISLGSGFLVEPKGQPIPVSNVESVTIPTPNQIIYNSNEPFPGKLYSEVGTYGCKGYKILVLRLHPVQYKPLSGELYCYSDLSVSVQTIPDESCNNNLFRGLQSDKFDVISRVDNPSTIDNYVSESGQLFDFQPSKKPDDYYDLLIITSEELKSSFEPLKEAHDSYNRRTLIYSVEDIYNNFSGVDNAEKVRNFIKYAYSNMDIEYVLLGGDSQIIPCRYFYTWLYDSEYENIISDLYYSCLDGSFNYDGDGKWGEPNDGENGGDVDLLAEVYVGRACVDNAEDVQNFTEKTIYYMSLDENENYLKKVALRGEILGFPGLTYFGRAYLNELIDKCYKHGYITQGFPSDTLYIEKIYDTILGKIWSSEEILDKINNGSFHIIVHDGHANQDVVMHMDSDDVSNFTNTDPFFVYSVGCCAGDFDFIRDCIAEHFTVKTSNGAFAGIFNSMYGLAGYGDWITTDGPSQRFNRQFWDAVFGEDITVISKANQDSKEDNIWRIDEGGMRYTFYELTLFGDPAVQLKYSDSLVKINNQDYYSDQQQTQSQQQQFQSTFSGNI